MEPEHTEYPSNGTHTVRWAAFLFLAALAAYSNSFRAPFFFDDKWLIVESPAIRSFWPPTGLGPNRAVGHWSLAFNYHLGGANVFGYHLVNFAVHVLAGWTLFGLVRRTLRLPSMKGRYDGWADYLAFGIALLWLVHPLQTEAVTYVIQRLESMMALFYLLCMYCLVRGSQTSQPLGWYAGAILACWAGMKTKEVMFTAPAVAVLYDRIFLANSWKAVLRQRGWVYAAFLPAAAWTLFQARDALTPNLGDGVAGDMADPQQPAASAGFGAAITPWQYLRSQAGVILHYLRLAFWPDVLCLDRWWRIAVRPVDIYLPGAAIVSLLVASFAALAKWPKVGFLGVAFFLLLAPTSSFVPIVDLAVEHRMYLPLAVVVTITVLGLHAVLRFLFPERRAQAIAFAWIVGLAALALMARTFVRNADYNDPVRFWSKTIAVVPHNARAFNNLGIALEERGDEEGALAQFRRAVELDPYYDRAHFNLARKLYARKEVDAALAHYRRAVELSPQNFRAHNNLAIALAEQGQPQEAIPHYLEAIRLAPHEPKYPENLGNLYVRQGEFALAATQFRQSLTADPNYLPALIKLGVCLHRTGDHREAVQSLTKAIGLAPQMDEAILLLAWILATSEDESVRDGGRAVELATRAQQQSVGGDPQALDVLAAAYAEAGRFSEAVQTAQRAHRLAEAQGSPLAGEVGVRTELYERGSPYRESSEKRKGFFTP